MLLNLFHNFVSLHSSGGGSRRLICEKTDQKRHDIGIRQVPFFSCVFKCGSQYGEPQNLE
ncbi:hypothetical protein SBV1_2680003 [Verrucomicrobia bacterium]|nr:hypothetical protein SBV1_2680003 [Verrucomicrobiota bacterium]